ncbi:hypothetical protein D3C80_586810 [compost metagenome]
MDDVVRHTVFAGGDENLLAGDPVGAIALRYSLGAQQAEIGAAMGLGEVHGARPCAFDHSWQIGGLLLIRAMHEDGGDRALRQARIHHQRHVGGRHVFADGGMQSIGKPLPAELFRHGKTDPATLAILIIGFFETLRYGDRAIIPSAAAFLIA